MARKRSTAGSRHAGRAASQPASPQRTCRRVRLRAAFSPACSTIARASGCSLRRSTEAAMREHRRLRRAPQPDDVGDLRSAHGERPGLVEGHRLELRHLFEVDAALDEHAAARGAGQGGQDADRRGDHQRARAADDEQREAAVEPGVEGGAEQRRHEGDGRRQGDHDRRVPRGEAVDDALRRRALRLRLLHQVDDLGDGVVGRDGRGAQAQRRRPRRSSRRTPGRRAPWRPATIRR